MRLERKTRLALSLRAPVLVALLLLFLPTLWAPHSRASSKVHDLSNADLCDLVLIDRLATHMMVDPEGQKVYVGKVAQIARLFQDADPNNAHFDGLLRFLGQMLTKPEGDLLVEVASAINSVSNKKSDLLMCIVSSSCDLGEVGAAYIPYTPDGFRVDSLYSTSPAPDHSRMDMEGVESGKRADLIFLKASSEAILEFAHEATHLADMQRTRAWIDANKKLAQKGQDTDLLFKMFIKEEGDGMTIDDGFFLLYLEGRAYRAMEQAARMLSENTEQAEKELKGYREYLKEKAYNYLKKFYGPRMDAAFAYTGVQGKDDVFEAANRIARDMDATIARANELD